MKWCLLVVSCVMVCSRGDALLAPTRRPHAAAFVQSSVPLLRSRLRPSSAMRMAPAKEEDVNAQEISRKNLEAIRKFSEQYARVSDTRFCSDLSITATVLKGLADHKTHYGAPLCPCRHYEDKALEVKTAYWNCPCVPMQERKECHCMLFLTPDNPFAGQERQIAPEELERLINEQIAAGA
ncbi:unnamed protein product [Vitrella brassicaformis CCMP3155]|uniref:ferredoxin:thioredoxin reductase n=1 Tax=Vitrella brassicaformis (strain CCMP3155) TaxID=1169540 RepID=A0A0G4EMG3_VITBC|nr:unnamed protein product [Vitrella brassicaformis CCMP3155]|eukprot:CEL98191.1 unnamed protein product [Vitrella brassicaformis CCMP3155]